MDVSDLFYFFCSGEGQGESEAPGRGGGQFPFFENSQGVGVSQERGGVPRGLEVSVGFFLAGWGG